MKYMIIHYIDEAILNAEADGDAVASPDEERELRALDEELEARGILVGGGVLKAPRSSTTVRVRDGEVLITDGPFAETKEQVAGYSVLECSDLDQAIEVTSRHPTARFGVLEIRPFLAPPEVPAPAVVDDEARALRYFLDYQRAAVISIVDGLDEEAWHSPIVGSGWTPAGLVEHLGGAERHWFQYVILGRADELPWDEGRPPYDPDMALTCERPSADVIAYYREQCARSNAVLDAVPLSAVPLGRHAGGSDEQQPPNVRWVVLHMIEETASHSGHLDIAREMADGRTNLGGR